MKAGYEVIEGKKINGENGAESGRELEKTPETAASCGVAFKTTTTGATRAPHDGPEQPDAGTSYEPENERANE